MEPSLMGTDKLNESEQQEKLLNVITLMEAQTMAQLLHLGFSYHERYQENFQPGDLESAIMHYKNALQKDTVDSDDLGLLLNNLGAGLVSRFNQLGHIQDLEEAITYHERVLDLFPTGHPERSMSLNNVGDALYSRYKALGEMGDLEKALSFHEEALNLCLPGSDASIFLNNFALTLKSKYDQLGDTEDLERAINYQEQALHFHPLDDQERPMYLDNLGLSLYTKYQQLGDIANLEKAKIYHEQALDLHNLSKSDHNDISRSLNNLALTLYSRYQQLGELGDLEKAINCHEQALGLRHPGHPLRSSSLNNLALALYARYQQLGEMSDLQVAISYHKQTLELHPVGHLGRAMSLNNLGIALRSIYEQFGEIKDLEMSISYHEQALSLHPIGHPFRPSSLHNLANVLYTRYLQLKERRDLEKAITYQQQALDSFSLGHPERPKSLNNLALALSIRYHGFGEMVDLESAITYQEQALSLHLPGYPHRPVSLNDLAHSLSTRYKKLGDKVDLDQSIRYHEQALQLCPPGHPERARSLGYLASTLSIRYKQVGDELDLAEATKFFKAALQCLPSHHPICSSAMFGQALLLMIVHQSRWASCDGCSHVNDACKLFLSAAQHSTSNLPDRFKAAKECASVAHNYKHPSAINAYSLALNLQQQHLALLPSITSQQKLIESSAQLCLNAASCAISTNELEMAVQLLEQGRSILWAKIQGYRQSFHQISEIDPQLADEFQAVALQLEQIAVSDGVDIGHQRTLSEKWATLLERIRKIEGFSDYLQATPFKVLQNAAAEGPVIIVNISDFRSDAIILVSHTAPVLVSLPDASPQILKYLIKKLMGAAPGTKSSNDLIHVLHHLWNAVAYPVINKLSDLGVPHKSHIWWCPTSYLCALPLHAAGLYRKGHKCLPDLYISSYTPTLASLIRARSIVPEPQSALGLFLVSQPDDTIPQVFEETKVIKKFGIQVDPCSGRDAYKQTVLAGLQSHSWVHFACHGHLAGQPFDSWFQIGNGERLTVLDLVRAKLPNAEFAFLSACHSAAGSILGTPDESIHLAAALQFCGFRSVIGTLWEMVDDDGPVIANAFYKHMLCDMGKLNLKNAAEALNIATRTLRRQGVPPDRWINFIHIGA